jgi:hypothetical protein
MSCRNTEERKCDEENFVEDLSSFRQELARSKESVTKVREVSTKDSLSLPLLTLTSFLLLYGTDGAQQVTPIKVVLQSNPEQRRNGNTDATMLCSRIV